VVFITGACVLVVEVVATRILAPYFGNTIYSYSSILGVVLAALSIGYYFGGRLADNRPEEKLFYSIVALGGAAIFLLHILTITLLPTLSDTLSITSGPLVASAFLFLPPAVLLGTLSPFAIKLQQVYAPSKGVGTIAGEMFFWSTLGSIAGSLLTGFVLVPYFGVDHIILGVGFLVISLGLVPLLILNGKRFRFKGGLFLLAALMFVTQAPVIADVTNIPGTLVYRDDGLYERISIYDDQLNGRPARFFQQDRSYSGAMYLDSNELAYDYTKYYSVYKLLKPDTREALVIGGGAYSIPKALLQDSPDMHVDVSEIEPSLYDLGQKYFKVPKTDRLTNYTEDGRRLLSKSDKTYDLIFSDVYYSAYSVPAHFTTQEFFELARDRMNQDGVFVANLIGSLDQQTPSFILSEMRTFQKAFPNSYFFASGSPDSLSTQNIVFVGSKSDKKLDLNSEAVTRQDDPTLARLGSKAVDPRNFDLGQYPVLTDNYAPIEYLLTPVLRQQKQSAAVNPGQRMLQTIKEQLAFGARHSGTPGHDRVVQYIATRARAISPVTVGQQWQEYGQQGQAYQLQNVILRLQPDNPRRIIVSSHFDSKATANLDKAKPSAPVPGANDSASGVAVLLEAARTLQDSPSLKVGVDFVFFDGEEGLPDGGVDSGQWQTYGSQYFVKNLASLYPDKKPEGGIVMDMVCDRDLKIYQEPASLRHAAAQTNKFWSIGNSVSPGTFRPTNDSEIVDDHTALNNAGIPSFLVIDLGYPAFHTTGDTADKCSAKSLATVSETLVRYLQQI